MSGLIQSSIYTIYIYDHNGNAALLLDNYTYLEYHQRINNPWNHVIRVELAADDYRLDFFRDTLVRDYIIIVYRTDPVTGSRELSYEGFNRTHVDQIKQDGSVVITLYGTGFTQLLDRRVVIPAVGQENSSKSGAAETIMKQFVDEQAINPVDTSRVILGLSNQVDTGAGNVTEYTARYTKLSTVIAKCAEQGEVYYGIIGGTNVGTFEFRVATLWGTDRRIGNPAGNGPTLFDVYLNNMTIPILSNQGRDEVNFVYVGGEGQGVDRTIVTVQNSPAIDTTPWNRSEAFVDARSEAGSDGLITHGQAYINEHKSGYKFTFNNEQTEGTRWLRDWELGDLISARYAGRLFHKLITEVSVVVSAGETGQSIIEVISLEMEDVPAP